MDPPKNCLREKSLHERRNWLRQAVPTGQIYSGTATAEEEKQAIQEE